MVVDRLRPSVHVYQPVDRGQLASQNLFALGKIHSFKPPYIIDRDNGRPVGSPRGSDIHHVGEHVRNAVGPGIAKRIRHDPFQFFSEKLRTHDGLHSLPAFHLAQVLLDVDRPQLAVVLLVAFDAVGGRRLHRLAGCVRHREGNRFLALGWHLQ